MALPKIHRLKHRRDFKTIYQKGKRRKSKNLTLLVLQQKQAAGKGRQPPNQVASPEVNTTSRLDIRVAEPPDDRAADSRLGQNLPNPGVRIVSPTQIGISISQKVSKRAVVRNRIKRQIRAAMRHLLPGFASGWNLVIVVQPSAVQCDYLEFLRELEQLLVDAEVLHGHS